MFAEPGGEIKAVEPHKKEGGEEECWELPYLGQQHKIHCLRPPHHIAGFSVKVSHTDVNPQSTHQWLSPCWVASEDTLPNEAFQQRAQWWNQTDLRNFLPFLFSFFFLFVIQKSCIRVTAYFAMHRWISFTYRGYTGVTGRMYPFKNCSNYDLSFHLITLFNTHPGITEVGVIQLAKKKKGHIYIPLKYRLHLRHDGDDTDFSWEPCLHTFTLRHVQMQPWAWAHERGWGLTAAH